VPRGREWVNVTVRRSVYMELKRRAGGKSISDYIEELLGSQVNKVEKSATPAQEEGMPHFVYATIMDLINAVSEAGITPGRKGKRG